MICNNDEPVERIEASFGPINVSVEGNDTDDVFETFEAVWEDMMEASERMQAMQEEEDDDRGTGPSFG